MGLCENLTFKYINDLLTSGDHTMEYQLKDYKRIAIDPKIMVGKPVIRGTRIPVYVILNLLGEGCSFEEITQQYPDIIQEDILAAIKFAAKFTDFEEVGA